LIFSEDNLPLNDYLLFLGPYGPKGKEDVTNITGRIHLYCEQTM